MIAELSSLLLEWTLALSAAAAVVLLCRRAWCRWFGARAAYALWGLVPLVMLALLLPEPAQRDVLPLTTVLPAVLDAGTKTSESARSWVLPALLAVWLVGALLSAVVEWLRQRRFIRAMGELQPRGDGTLRASGVSGPAVVGLWRARIVVPADFEREYDPLERALILGHERVHVERRDLIVNLAAVALRCLQWFNPIVRLAFIRFRFDQELAADAVVMQRQPGAGRRYAGAMLKAQLSQSLSPLGCHWQSAHPLKERILMLNRPIPGFRRVAFGLALATGLSLAFGYTAWATQPRALDDAKNPPTYARIKPPRYPQSAIDAKAEGEVLLRVLVNAQGTVDQVEIDRSTGYAELDQAAIDSVRNWRFNPADNGYSPVSSWIGVPIEFSLTDKGEPEPAPAGDSLDEIYVRPKPQTSQTAPALKFGWTDQGTLGWVEPSEQC